MVRFAYGKRFFCKKEKIKITEMSIPFKGEIVQTDTADSGEIVILSDNTLKLNDILGDEKLLPSQGMDG